VIIVVGPERWTLASEDTEALELMEGLIDLIQNPRIEPVITSGNYSLYLLQRASASETQATLQELFSPSDSRRSRLPSSLADMSRRIRIVADDRTNALIVSGSVNDRKLIEELLGVLDSEELLGNLQQILPTTIALRSATAQQAESIIRDIYRSQLTASAGRRPLPIPEGVSSEVATLLQQISAQASGPVLAITSDEVTNSIVLRAPQELTNEIRQFIKSLDEQTAVTPARRVELIRLQSTNASNLERALRRLLSR
jgi:type II secretory pathway component GspD/PulD (secretin)